jgi:hypothetical protein
MMTPAVMEAASRRIVSDRKIRQWLPWMIMGLGIAIRLMLLRMPGYAGDVDDYLLWSRQMVTSGFSTAYTLKEPIVNYPPVVLAVLALIGEWYRAFVSLSLSLAQLAYFTSAVKIVFAVFELAAGIAGYVYIRRMADDAGALFVLSALVLNPALFLDSGYWAGLDSLHTLLIILGLIGLSQRRWGWAWISLVLAGFSKPPAIALIPIAGFYTLWVGGWRGVGRGVLAGILTGAAVYSPFILAGHWEAFTAPLRFFEMYPIWSANAHNLWWLLSGARGGDFAAGDAVGGLIRISTIGWLLFITIYIYAVISLRRRPEPATLWSAAAFVALGSFLTLTGLHENHTYMVVALLVVATGLNVRMLPLVIVYSLTATINILAHDPLLLFSLKPLADRVGYGFYAAIRPLTWLNALVNVLGIMWWSLQLGPDGSQHPEAPQVQV